MRRAELDRRDHRGRGERANEGDHCRAPGGMAVRDGYDDALARERSIKVIEDCAQAHGATYKGRPVGSLGDAAAFSFCQDKIMTTGGEGGMLTTNDDAAWERARSFRDHGAGGARRGTARIRMGFGGCTIRLARIGG